MQQAQRELADTVKNMAPEQANGVVQARANDIMQQAGSSAAAPASAAPAVGTVQQGFRFNGGDPSSPGSWARVQ